MISATELRKLQSNMKKEVVRLMGLIGWRLVVLVCQQLRLKVV